MATRTKVEELPPLEAGHPIPPEQAPRKGGGKTTVDPLVRHFQNADHGDSVRIKWALLPRMKYAARKAGWTVRWREDGHMPITAQRAVRMWLLEKGGEP